MGRVKCVDMSSAGSRNKLHLAIEAYLCPEAPIDKWWPYSGRKLKHRGKWPELHRLKALLLDVVVALDGHLPNQLDIHGVLRSIRLAFTEQTNIDEGNQS